MKEDVNKELEKDYYFSEKYVDKDRFVSYFWQNQLVRKLKNIKNILEIGAGNNIVHSILQKQGYSVKTLDINEKLSPDFSGSVCDMHGVPVNTFDIVLCAEVLEHLPFEDFIKSLNEIHRVTKKYAIISLPYWGYTFGIRFRLPFLGKKTFQYKISGIKNHEFNGQHYWEIGKKGYPVKKIKEQIEKSGFEIKNSFWDLDDPYHYYFVLEKI